MNTLLLGLIAAFCWGLHDIAIRFLSRSVPLLSALFIVFLTGLIFQIGTIFIGGGTFLPTGAALWYSICTGIALLIAGLSLYYAFQRGPVRLVSPIIGAYPVLSILIAIFAGSPITAGQIAAVLTIVCAVGLVAVFSDSDSEKIPPKGPTILLSLISAIGFASTFALGQIAAEMGEEWQGTFMARLVATGLLCIILIALRADLRIKPTALVILTIMGLLDGIALLAVISAGALDQPEFASVAASMFGLFTILLARVLLKETMTPIQWGSCIVAFLGIGYLSI